MNITARIESPTNTAKLGAVPPGTVITVFGDAYVVLAYSQIGTGNYKDSPFTVPVLDLQTLQFNRLNPDNTSYIVVGTLKIGFD